MVFMVRFCLLRGLTPPSTPLLVPAHRQVDRMKRRHPNIYNEIYMEKEVLGRLRHPCIVRLYQTFQVHLLVLLRLRCRFFIRKAGKGGGGHSRTLA